MTAILVFWSLIAIVSLALATLREVYTDGSNHPDHPPRSHQPDEFARTGSSWY